MTRPFRFIAPMPRLDQPPGRWRDAVRRIEDLGYATVSISDHFTKGWMMEIGLGTGWLQSDHQAAGMPLDPPATRIDRPPGRGRPGAEGPVRAGAAHLRRDPLPGRGARRAAKPGPAPLAAAAHRRRRPQGPVGWPGATPTWSASTRACAPAR